MQICVAPNFVSKSTELWKPPSACLQGRTKSYAAELDLPRRSTPIFLLRQIWRRRLTCVATNAAAARRIAPVPDQLRFAGRPGAVEAPCTFNDLIVRARLDFGFLRCLRLLRLADTKIEEGYPLRRRIRLGRSVRTRGFGLIAGLEGKAQAACLRRRCARKYAQQRDNQKAGT